MNFALPKNTATEIPVARDTSSTISSTDNGERKVLLRVKRKRGEDPLSALIIQESIKLPKRSKIEERNDGEFTTGIPSQSFITEERTKAVATTGDSEEITSREEEKAIILFRRLGTVPASDAGITQKKATKLLRKFKEIERSRSRSLARRNRNVDGDISWYNDDSTQYKDNAFDRGAGADDRLKRVATNTLRGKKRRDKLINERRKAHVRNHGVKSVDRNANKETFNNTFDVVDIETKGDEHVGLDMKEEHKKIGSGENQADPGQRSKLEAVEKNEKAYPLVAQPITKASSGLGKKIMSPTDTLMDIAIFKSFREGPKGCDLILDALNQGCNVNFYRFQADNTTALMAACFQGRADVVLRLIECGSDMRLLDQNNRSALDFAKIGNHLDIVTELLQIGGMTGTQILQELEEESRNSQYVYDYYYLKGVAVGPGQNDGTDAAFAVNQSTIKVEKSMSNALAGPSNGISSNESNAFSNSAILDITTKYKSKFLRAADTQSYVNYTTADHLYSDAINPDEYQGLDEFLYENDAHDLSELDDSNDSNAENFLGNEYPDSDPGIQFTSEDEDANNQYTDDYENEMCLTTEDGEEYYY